MNLRIPAYFDQLISGFAAGRVGRHAHLGYWDDPPPLSTPCEPGEFARAQARLNDIMISLARLKDGLTLLDVGCGFGGALEAAAKYANMRLIGVNIDSRQLQICRTLEKGLNSLELFVADACALPFPPASFDRVLCIEAMFHFSSRRTFLEEAARVLRPGGRLVVSDILIHELLDMASSDVRQIEFALQGEYGPWPRPRERIEDILIAARDAGLSRKEVMDATWQTLPSHRITAPHAGSGLPSGVSAGQTLRWLHETGRLSYLGMSFTKV